MDLSFSPEDLAFQAEVRDWLRANLPPAIKQKMHVGDELTKEERIQWQKLLAGKGWMAPGWPVKHGGQNWTVTQRHIFEEEFAKNDAPSMLPFGVAMVAPVIIEFRQRRTARALPAAHPFERRLVVPGLQRTRLRLRPRLAAVEGGKRTATTTCSTARRRGSRSRSSPTGSSSSLAPTRRRRSRTASRSSSSTWRRRASPCVRSRRSTAATRSMKSPSRTSRVPVGNLVGKENEAWTYAKFLLEHERNGTAGVAGSFHMIDRLKAMAKSEHVNGSVLLDDVEFQQKIASTEIELLALSVRADASGPSRPRARARARVRSRRSSRSRARRSSSGDHGTDEGRGGLRFARPRQPQRQLVLQHA